MMPPTAYRQQPPQWLAERKRFYQQLERSDFIYKPNIDSELSSAFGKMMNLIQYIIPTSLQIYEYARERLWNSFVEDEMNMRCV